MKMAIFDAKEYDIRSFSEQNTDGQFDLHFFETRLTAETLNLTVGMDAVCVFVNDEITQEVIDGLCKNKVKVLALRCAGFNNVDVEAARGRIPIVRVPAYSPQAVAEHTMAMLLTSVRRIHKAYIRTREFNFSLSGLTGMTLYGKTVGIIGMGRIGKCFAEICLGFGMTVLAYDREPQNDDRIEITTLEDIWSRSDIISLHCPLTEDTTHLIHAGVIDKMKKGVILLNTSRGALVDSEALLEGIKKKKIGAACLDVYEEESDFFFRDCSGHIMSDDTLARLISMPNVIVTSHQGFLTREALMTIASATLQNVREIAEHGPGNGNYDFLVK